MNKAGLPSILLTAAIVASLPTAQAGLFFGPDGYHECILDRLDGATDDNEATRNVVSCRNDFSPMAPEAQLHPLFFGPKTVKECLEKHLAETSSPFAVSQIQEACLLLYRDSGESSTFPQ